MSVLLTPEVERLILETVERGPYSSPDDVVREALGLLEARDRGQRDSVREDLRVGLEQIARGEVVDGPSSFEALRTKVAGRR